MAILTGQEIKIENEPRETVSDTNKTLEQKLVEVITNNCHDSHRNL